MLATADLRVLKEKEKQKLTLGQGQAVAVGLDKMLMRIDEADAMSAPGRQPQRLSLTVIGDGEISDPPIWGISDGQLHV